MPLMLKLPITAAMVAMMILPAYARMVTITPTQIGEIFCIGSLGNDMVPVEALLTPEFSQAISDAWNKNARIEAAAPGEKPPLGDGLPWRSWTDYADSCEVTDASVNGDEARVGLWYGFAASPEANYGNTLILRRTAAEAGAPAVWRIDNIDFGADGGTMRQSLFDAFMN